MTLMNRTFLILILLLSGCGSVPTGQQLTISWDTAFPVYDHIVVVVEENKGWDQIVGRRNVAPYLNKLIDEGASLDNMFGEEHLSQGNYFWLFSGSNQGLGLGPFDRVPTQLFQSSNLAERLNTKKLSFKGYSESLPYAGFDGIESPDRLYHRKHAPWVSFDNVQNAQVEGSVNAPFSEFPSDFKKLPTVSFVIPNLKNDMHDVTNGVDFSISRGDSWLRENIGNYYQWAKDNNSLLIVTFDEDNNSNHILPGQTDPNATDLRRRNRIPTIFAGAHIRSGFHSMSRVTHVNILRTIEAMYGLEKSGMQQRNAILAGITDDFIITDVFKP